jgi:error-prone DNA polymerase
MMVGRMVARGYDPDFAAALLQPDQGFRRIRLSRKPRGQLRPSGLCLVLAEVPFSGVFACALLNSQPMGFYAPAQIVRDAREHGVMVLPVDVNHSGWDCTLEVARAERIALRLGLRQVDGFPEHVAAAGRGARRGGRPSPTLPR